MTCPALSAFTAAVLSWGGDAPSSVTLRPAEGGAEVVFRNTLTHSSPGAFFLQLGPLVARVHVEFGPGVVPDVLNVEVPDEWIAVPPALVVQDGSTGVIRIFCRETMGLG